MSNTADQPRKRVTPNAIRERKNSGKPITLVTAYDYPFAHYAEQAGVDIVFVSDAFASVGMGRPDTLSVTIEEVLYHTHAVRRATNASLLLASMPFLSYTTPREAIANAGRLIKEGGAQAVEVEGCADLAPTVHALCQAGIAVVAHVGLTKKIAASSGSYRGQGQDVDGALNVIEDAMALADAGAFAIVLECIPDRVAAVITKLIDVPTIGFGAGPACDGQALVSQDLLGLFDKFTPKFVQKFAALGDHARAGFKHFMASVNQGEFPAKTHGTAISDEVLTGILTRLENLDHGLAIGNTGQRQWR